jgi:trans-aconitate methyltransferase
VRFRHVCSLLEELPRPQRVLDAGCGDGRLAWLIARRFPRASVLGIDVDDDSLLAAARLARRVPTLELRRASVGAAALAERFDVVVCTDVLEHLADDTGAVAWLAGQVAASGHLVLHVPATPQRHALASVARHTEQEVASGRGPHLREGYTPNGITTLLVGAGLRPVLVAFTFHAPLTRWAADVETWTFVHRRRAVKAALLPALLLGAASERRPSRSRRGNGLLICAANSGSRTASECARRS